MSLYLYGIIINTKSQTDRNTKRIDFGPVGFEHGRVKGIPYGEFTVVYGTPPMNDLLNLPKEILIHFLLHHQKTLESIMKNHFVLPFKFGTIVQDEAELTKVLEQGKTPISNAYQQVKNCAEIDVIATWDVSNILREIASEDPEIVNMKKNSVNGLGDTMAVGMLLEKALKKKSVIWCQEITKIIGQHAVALTDHDLLNDKMVCNASFLVRNGDEDKFYKDIEDADKKYEDKLNFKCVGPLPPHSFATLVIQRLDAGQVAEAAKLLRLNGRAEITEVKRNYKELSRGVHPDTNPKISSEEFEKLYKAYELIASYCKDEPRSLEKTVIEQFVRIDVSGITEGSLHAA